MYVLCGYCCGSHLFFVSINDQSHVVVKKGKLRIDTYKRNMKFMSCGKY